MVSAFVALSWDEVLLVVVVPDPCDGILATAGRAVLDGSVLFEGLVPDRVHVVRHRVETHAAVPQVRLICLERFEPFGGSWALLVALALAVEGVPEEVFHWLVDVAPHVLPVAFGLVLVVPVLVLEGEVALLDELHHVAVGACPDVRELAGHDDHEQHGRDGEEFVFHRA